MEIDELLTDLDENLAIYQNKYASKTNSDWQDILKTIHNKSITLEDWNHLNYAISNLMSDTKSQDGYLNDLTLSIRYILEQLKSALVSISDNAGEISRVETKFDNKVTKINTALDRKLERNDLANYVTMHGMSQYTYSKGETESKLALKADLVNGKIPSAQLPSYVDDIKVFEKAQPFNKTFNLELEDMGLFTNTFGNNDRTIINRLSSILDLDGASHQTLTSFGYFLVDITTTFSIMGSEENQTACYVYHFVEVSGGVEFKQLTNEELQDVIATNILLCHQTNKSYRVVNREIPFGQNILGTTQSGIALTNTQYFAEIVSTLALGETSSTAFAGNRGKILETKMAKVESDIENLSSQIEDAINNSIAYATDDEVSALFK